MVLVNVCVVVNMLIVDVEVKILVRDVVKSIVVWDFEIGVWFEMSK